MTTVPSHVETTELTYAQRVRAAAWVLRWQRRGEPAIISPHRAAELTPAWNGEPLVGVLGDHTVMLPLEAVATRLVQVCPTYEAGGAVLAAMGRRRS